MRRYKKTVDKFLEKRRLPPHMRSELDIDCRMEGQSIEIFEIRPLWNNPDEMMESSIAKATFVKSRDHWKVFWMRADSKWHGYGPCPVVKTLEEFLDLIHEDQFGCFWG